MYIKQTTVLARAISKHGGCVVFLFPQNSDGRVIDYFPRQKKIYRPHTMCQEAKFVTP